MITTKQHGQTKKASVISNQGLSHNIQLSLYFLVIVISTLFAMALFPEIALTGKFDINAGVKAATDPLIKAVDEHWGKAVVLTGCAAAVIGEGDARQRAVRAGMASTAAGGVVLALLAMLT